MNGEIRVVDHVPQAFAELVAAEAPRSIALSGGDTARHAYELLAVADVEWGAVEVYFGDERWVPIDDPESNEGMARHAFLDQVEPVRDPFDAPCRRHAGGRRDRVRATRAGGTTDRPRAPRARARRPHRVALPRIAGIGGGSPLRGRNRRRRPSAPEAHVHVPGARERAARSCSRSPVPRRPTHSRACRPATTCPPRASEADRVIWLVDPAAAGHSLTPIP